MYGDVLSKEQSWGDQPPATGGLIKVISVQAPTQVTAGSQYTVTVTVQNTFSKDETVTVSISYGGQVLASQTKTIKANSTETYTLSLTAPTQSGQYTYLIKASNDASDETTYTINVVSSGGGGGGGGITTTKAGIPPEYIIIAMIVIVIILQILILLK